MTGFDWLALVMGATVFLIFGVLGWALTRP